MGEIFESLGVLCNPELFKACCNADCISKCCECPGNCISGVCTCVGNCCKDINCDWFSTLCSTCCSCSDNPYSKIFEHSCCMNMEHTCLSVFNCGNDINIFSKGIENFCSFFSNRCLGALTCWLKCLPAQCFINLGYGTNAMFIYGNTNQVIVSSTNPQRENFEDEGEKKKKDEECKENDKNEDISKLCL